jgi:disulfide bond formation protein DsbB
MIAGGRDPLLIAFMLGASAFLLILGALWFQYFEHLAPCEMCMWQRYPHILAGFAGIGGYMLVRAGVLPRSIGNAVAIATVCLIALSGAIGVYHAGVEWHWWPGPQACTGNAFRLSGGALDLNAPVVSCDHAAWRLFGLSLAGYNAILSFALAAAGLTLLTAGRREK